MFAAMPDADTLSELDPHRWAAFVRSTTSNATQPTISRRTGIDQGTISRWLNESRPTPPSVRAVVAFARAYKVNVIGALVIAGYITEADSRRRAPVQLVDLRDVPTDEIIAELGRRAEQGAA